MAGWAGGDTIDKALSRMGFASSGSTGASSLGLGADPTAGALGFNDFMGQSYGVDPTSMKALNGLGGDPTQMAGGSGLGLGYDPTSLAGADFGIAPNGKALNQFGFAGDPTGMGAGFGDLDAYWNKKNAEWAAQMKGGVGGTGTPGASGDPRNIGGGSSAGGVSSLGGDWANIDKLNADIARAAAQVGVDPNQMKAIMKLESGGIWQTSPAGAIGYMQVMPFWGQDLGLDLNDPYQNLVAGAMVLKQNLDQSGGDFYEALRRYHGYGSDGYTTDKQYADIVTANYQQLMSAGGGAGAVSGGGWQSAFSTMFGTNAVPDWGEFNAPSDLGYYTYGNQYGMNGVNHTGLDIPLALNTPMRAGFSGHVVCSGTNNGTGEDSCSAFNDYYGARNGRIEIMSDDGNTVLIYGHSSQTAVRPGQQINAGDVVGYSGGENSEHVHLEARVRDASMPSGWRIVDPRTVLGGGVPTGNAGSPVGGYTSTPGGGSTYGNPMMDALLIPGWHW